MDESAMVKACTGVVDTFANATREKMEAEQISNGSVADFFHCLGGAVARFILRTGSKINKPEILDSFLEGFSGFVRFTKETQAWEEDDTSPNLFRFLNLVDNDRAKN